MIKVKKEGVILEPTELEFENQAVLNPTCIQEGNTVHLYYRAVKEGNYSSIGYARLEGPIKVVERARQPILSPSEPYDIHGTEDPRMVYLDGTYYLFYTAYDGSNALVALATSQDTKVWKKHGVISPTITYQEAEKHLRASTLKESYFMFSAYLQQRHGKKRGPILLWDKDAFIFPEKINGKFLFVHRILPDIQYAFVDNFEQLKDKKWWINYLKNIKDNVLLENKYWFENRNIGAGGPPIKTRYGWLFIYHSVESQNDGRQYSAAAALFSKKDPTKLIARSREPLFVPEEEWELKGDVDNVVFPTGNSVFNDRLYIYYGAADSRIAVASVGIKELIVDLKKNYKEN